MCGGGVKEWSGGGGGGGGRGKLDAPSGCANAADAGIRAAVRVFSYGQAGPPTECTARERAGGPRPGLPRRSVRQWGGGRAAPWSRRVGGAGARGAQPRSIFGLTAGRLGFDRGPAVRQLQGRRRGARGRGTASGGSGGSAFCTMGWVNREVGSCGLSTCPGAPWFKCVVSLLPKT